MHEVFYLDLYCLVNFSLDALCLFAVSRILPRPVKLSRLILASCFGSFASAICVFPVTPPLVDLAVLLITLPLSCMICFPPNSIGDLLRSALLLILCLFFFGGSFTALESLSGIAVSSQEFNLASILFAAMILALTVYFFHLTQRRFQKNIQTLGINFDGTLQYASALVDSGNLLIHPQSGRPVVLVSRNAAHLIAKEKHPAFCPDAPSVCISTPAGTKTLFGFFVEELFLCTDRTKQKLAPVLFVFDEKTASFGGCDLLIPSILLPL